MSNKVTLDYCQQLGNLFYAIALADKRIELSEYRTFKSNIESINQTFTELDLKGDLDMRLHIHEAFNKCYLDERDPDDCFEGFIAYKKIHEDLFPEKIRKLILAISSNIAASFSSQNKSELIRLATLSIELKKTN